MAVTADQVKELRERTGAGMMECKKALVESQGNFDRAVDLLRKSGIARAESRAARAASEGLVESYIHPGNRVGVLIEVNCETDFVARTPEFVDLVRNLAMQVAAAGAEVVRREDLPAERVERERAIFAAQMEGQKKPPAIVEKIVAGKLEKFYSEICLLEQPFIRDDKKTVGELVKEASARTGENIQVRRFARFRLGQE
ncbi:MAG TPA: translation elongation factor Ts [Candidatus Eisenbacteria bacterium]|jgi:elongation factor Ts